jgi:hypothetical protein
MTEPTDDLGPNAETQEQDGDTADTDPSTVADATIDVTTDIPTTVPNPLDVINDLNDMLTRFVEAVRTLDMRAIAISYERDRRLLGIGSGTAIDVLSQVAKAAGTSFPKCPACGYVAKPERQAGYL